MNPASSFQRVCDNGYAKLMLRTILVVDDDAAVRYALRRVFEADYRVVEAGTVPEARQRVSEDRPEVILLDYSLPGEDGLSFLKEFQGAPDSPAIVMITAHGSERLAVDAMKSGAYDYLAKPYDADELWLVVERAMERQQLRSEVLGLRDRLAGEGQFGRMVGASAVMQKLFQTAGRVAQTDLPLLMIGESGTGKDVLAQEIHARSARANNRFVAVNCAALPENLVESELFGHEKGAFTGANASRAGKFEQAHRGTLFLDEIGEMAPATQAKILRASESGIVERLGGTKPVAVDVRIISATNRDIDRAVREKLFREDLFYRLAGVTLYLPPLRERREDIPLLVELFWADLQHKYGRPGPELTRQARARLEEMPWPGNVRQLRNAVEKLFVLPKNEQVTGEDVTAAAGEARAPASSPLEAVLAAADFRDAKRLFEIEYITRKLREHGGNVSRTAAAIGFARQSLQEKIKELGIARGE